MTSTPSRLDPTTGSRTARTYGRRAFLRQVAFAAAGAAGLSAVAGCSSSSDAPVDLDAKQTAAMDDFAAGQTFVATAPLTIDVLYRDHPNYPNKADWLFYSALKETTGVDITPTLAPLSDYPQRRSLLIGAGDAPTLISCTNAGDEAPFVASGAILPVSDYTDLMPNFTEKVEAWGLQADLDRLRQEDGKFYVLPGLTERQRFDYTLAVRTDVLAELGLEEPQTWDDVEQVLTAIKAARPGGFPMSDRWKGDSLLSYAAPAFGTAAGWGLGRAVTWDGDAYVYTGATDGYRDLVTYFAGLVANGLLDPETFTQDDDTALAKLANQQAFVFSTNSQEVIKAQAALDTAIGAGVGAVAKIRMPSGPAGDLYSSGRLESGLMVSSGATDREDFVAVMQFVDWLYYSDEGLEFATWGVDGTTYTRVGDAYELAGDVTFQGRNPGAPKNLQADFGFFNGVYCLAQGSTWGLVTANMTDAEKAWQESMGTKEAVEPGPPFPFDEIELEQAGLKQTALTDLTKQATLQFILGQRPLSEWDAYLEQLRATDVDGYMTSVNDAQKRFASA